jgi:AAA domain, putative AbiEii toxin, Type IV TA system/AAA domain
VRIQSFRVLNYKSYADSGDILLSSGMNLVVGPNSVGKSALLEALGLRFFGRPHRSERSIPHPDDAELPTSTVLVQATGAGIELKRTFLRSTSTEYFPLPAGLAQNEATARKMVEELFSSEELTLSRNYSSDGNVVARGRGNEPVPVVWSTLPKPRQFARTFQIAPSSDRRTVGGVSLNVAGPSTLGEIGARTLMDRVFRLEAERTRLGKCKSGIGTVLEADASNLPAVLMNLWTNTGRFRQYEELIREVFPLVQAITVRHTDNEHLEIRVCQVDTSLKRADLSFPLSECGTGVGQVLALLYVVIASHDPQVVIIDEPNSFLHPGAARALMRLLRQFPRHQYIIGTHAPEVIAEAGDCPILRISWSDGASKCTVFSERNTAVNRQLLTDVGARLSDVFGFDSLLWVEGPSDQACFNAIIDAQFGRLPGLAIMPVRDTGNFERRKAADIVAIYKQASMGSALLPPTIGFLLDREGRTDEELERVSRESNGAVSFLQRRMLENYLIDPIAISEVLTVEQGSTGAMVSAMSVEQWLLAHGHDRKYGADEAIMSEPWLLRVHGGNLLRDLFADLTDSQVEFRKIRHCELIMRLLLKNRPTVVRSLASEVEAKISPSA